MFKYEGSFLALTSVVEPLVETKNYENHMRMINQNRTYMIIFWLMSSVNIITVMDDIKMDSMPCCSILMLFTKLGVSPTSTGHWGIHKITKKRKRGNRNDMGQT